MSECCEDKCEKQGAPATINMHGFTPAPDVILEDPSLGPIAALVFGKVWRCYHIDGKSASRARMAFEVGLTNSTFKKWLPILVKRGYLEITNPTTKNREGCQYRDTGKVRIDPLYSVPTSDLVYAAKQWQRKTHVSSSYQARRKVVWEKTEGHCYYCGKKLEREGWARDHLMPRSRGGTWDLENIVPCCKICNSSKGAKTLEEYRNYCQKGMEMHSFWAEEIYKAGSYV